MDDLISRQAVVRAVDRHTFDTKNGLCLDEDITVILEEVPSAEPGRKKGEWILQEDERGPLFGWLVCSECGTCVGGKSNFCLNCGADMREVDDGQV